MRFLSTTSKSCGLEMAKTNNDNLAMVYGKAITFTDHVTIDGRYWPDFWIG